MKTHYQDIYFNQLYLKVTSLTIWQIKLNTRIVYVKMINKNLFGKTITIYANVLNPVSFLKTDGS